MRRLDQTAPRTLPNVVRGAFSASLTFLAGTGWLPQQTRGILHSEKKRRMVVAGRNRQSWRPSQNWQWLYLYRSHHAKGLTLERANQCSVLFCKVRKQYKGSHLCPCVVVTPKNDWWYQTLPISLTWKPEKLKALIRANSSSFWLDESFGSVLFRRYL